MSFENASVMASWGSFDAPTETENKERNVVDAKIKSIKPIIYTQKRRESRDNNFFCSCFIFQRSLEGNYSEILTKLSTLKNK